MRRFIEAIAGLCVLLSLPPAGASAQSAQPLALLGLLPEPAGARGAAQVVALDAVNRTMYLSYQSTTDRDSSGAPYVHLIEYDLGPRIPQPVREASLGLTPSQLGSLSPDTVAIDSVHRMAFILGQNYPQGTARLAFIDLRTLTPGTPVDLTTVLPGFIGFGITYAAQDDRLYVVGEMAVSNVWGQNWVAGRKAASMVSTVAALDRRGNLVWARPAPQCQQVLNTYGQGSLIARSSRAPALYFACVTGGSGGGDAFPGESGMVRLGIAPGAGAADALSFPVDFFPVSGSYYNGAASGVAGYDPGSDRFFLQSLSLSTPGAWVFDGRFSGWSGFIAAPDATDTSMGIDEGNGHYYIGSQGSPQYSGGYLLIADGRQTPVPQGQLQLTGPSGMIPDDPVTHRIFPEMQLNELGLGRSNSHAITVMQDVTTDAVPPAVPDYDASTTDVPEGPGTAADFAGAGGGFGARILDVGGYGGALSNLGLACQEGLTCSDIGGLSPGDRGMYAAQVPELDLRNVSAGAGADALALDSISANDYQTLREASGILPDWQYPASSCLDSRGAPAQQSQSDASGGLHASSHVTCDQAGQVVSAGASFGGIHLVGSTVGQPGVNLTVAGAAFDASSARASASGTVSTATATTTGLRLAIDGAGALNVGRILNSATVSAHGRPGTTAAEWTRGFEDVKVTDASGNVVFACTSEDTCDPRAVAGAVNTVMGTRIRADLPVAQSTATPRGAFAAVRKSDAEYYDDLAAFDDPGHAVPALQLVVYSDSVEKSRLLLQFAALETSSIYEIHQLPQSAGGGGSPAFTSPLTIATTIIDSGPLTALAGRSVYVIRRTPLALFVQQLSRGVGFLKRSPQQAVLIAGLWLLIAAPAVALWRRGGLLGVLG